jgi:hypothetical protein
VVQELERERVFAKSKHWAWEISRISILLLGRATLEAPKWDPSFTFRRAITGTRAILGEG